MSTRESDLCQKRVFLIRIKSKFFFCVYLENSKIQTRTYFAGNIMLQPGYRHLIDPKEIMEKFPVSRKVTTDTFFLGTSPVITDEQINYIKEEGLDMVRESL